ncbi:hypothetical protein P171DRAFT_489690 [Karstenula rhodostoma CBS 690.94]|uniref:Uncharacterized protein n=1 Tax=Karstenula rhodostoma CBS 690.94 TaxID=1392251 RepID=A0A9P4PB70_9PLEO|nr:hypothetical protein P171DRAFT_489690 [Karstenula rhodostoma CBS 690.94]
MSSIQLPAQFEVAILDPQPPTAADNTCFGTTSEGGSCEQQLDPGAIERVNNLVASLQNIDPMKLVSEHLTLGPQGGVKDCFCSAHKEQSRSVVLAWLRQIRAVGKARNKAGVERWLEGVDAADGEGPAPEDEVEEGGESEAGEGGLSEGEEREGEREGA